MNKNEYLDLLRFYLRVLPKSITDDIVLEYSNHFDDGISFGKSEEEISRELGSPKDLAEEFISTEKKYYYGSNENLNENRQKSFFDLGSFKHENHDLLRKILKLILVVFLGLVLMPFLFSFIGLAFSLLIAGICLAFAAGLVGFTLLLSIFTNMNINGPFFSSNIGALQNFNPISKLSIGIFLILLMILAMKILIFAIGKVFKGIKDFFIYLKWKFVKGA